VLTAGAVALSATARLEVRAARRGVDQVQREAALRGGVNRGIALLERGRTDPETLLAALREYRELEWRPFVPETGPDEQPLQVALQLLDASARVNVNTADASQLQKLPGVRQDLAGSITGWRDERSRHRYDRGPRPYEPKRRPFDTIEELLLVNDVDAEQFFGLPGSRETRGLRRPPLSEWLTTLSGENNADAGGNPRADVNSASASELLDAANRYEEAVTEEQVRNLVQTRRQRQTGEGGGRSGSGWGFRTVSEALREAGVEEAKWGPVIDAWTADRRSFLPGRINVNTAPPAVLATVNGLTEPMIDQIVRKREQAPAGLEWSDLLDLVANTAQPGGAPGGEPPPQGQQQQQQGATDQMERLFCMRSSVYLVRFLVREPGSTRTDAVMALVYWPLSPDEPARIVQWRQPDRFPGWTAWFRPLAENEEPGSGR
jgi:DNA uptake protein ComE-like DNA-binding protein